MYKLGTTSLAHLAHVHPVLVELVERAIQISDQDFSVAEGCRSLADEKNAVATGHSKTLHSYHLIQPDGFGHAVDLVPFVEGKLQWLWPHIYPIVRAMRGAAEEFGVAGKIRWGGCWDKRLNNINCSTDAACAIEVQQYGVRHIGPDLLDGPHFEYRP